MAKTNKSPSFPFYSSDFLTGVVGMSKLEVGQYILLLCIQHQKGHLSENLIKKSVGKVSPAVMEKFEKDADGNYFNVRLENVIKNKENHCAKQRENVEKRWKNAENGVPVAVPNGYQTDTKPIPNSIPNGYQTDTADAQIGMDLVCPVVIPLEKEKEKEVSLSFKTNINNNNKNNKTCFDSKQTDVEIPEGARVWDLDSAILDDFADYGLGNQGVIRVGDPSGVAPPPKAPRTQRAKHGWVKLSDDEYARLIAEYGEEAVNINIAYIDNRAQLTGNKHKYKDWNLAVRNAIKGKWGEREKRDQQSPQTSTNGRPLHEFEVGAAAKYAHL